MSSKNFVQDAEIKHERPMPKGVIHDRRKKARPYSIQITIAKRRRVQYFATVAEAVAARRAHLDAKAAAKAEAFDALAPKRAENVARYGENSSLERALALRIRSAYAALFDGRRALVTNDGARSDVLLGLDDAWLALQLKTTTTAMKGNPNMWHFSKVRGYAGMPVVCWRADHDDAWVFDGGKLDERGKKDLYITPGGVNDRRALARGLSLDALLRWLVEHAARWPATTEAAARRDFRSTTHAKEYAMLAAFQAAHPERGPFAYPDEQNGHVDLHAGGRRQQHKSVRVQGRQAGLICSLLHTSAGRDENGKQLYAPYPADAFDELVVGWRTPEERFHFWVIPAAELAKREYFATTSGAGKMYLCVYGPEGVGPQPDPAARTPADTWTRAYYLG